LQDNESNDPADDIKYLLEQNTKSNTKPDEEKKQFSKGNKICCTGAASTDSMIMTKVNESFKQG